MRGIWSLRRGARSTPMRGGSRNSCTRDAGGLVQSSSGTWARKVPQRAVYVTTGPGEALRNCALWSVTQKASSASCATKTSGRHPKTSPQRVRRPTGDDRAGARCSNRADRDRLAWSRQGKSVTWMEAAPRSARSPARGFRRFSPEKRMSVAPGAVNADRAASPEAVVLASALPM